MNVKLKLKLNLKVNLKLLSGIQSESESEIIVWPLSAECECESESDSNFWTAKTDIEIYNNKYVDHFVLNQGFKFHKSLSLLDKKSDFRLKDNKAKRKFRCQVL